MKQSFAFPARQIHLDFHTSIHIPDVGAEFDARRFARTMKDAHVNSVTVFAKCHHGLLYYETKHPARHPGMKRGTDLLRRQVDALHDVGIRAPIYISVQCDEFAADTHPEWIVKKIDNTFHSAKPLQEIYPNFTWQILDMSSPYLAYLQEQTAEVLERFKPVDGIFFDMCWDQVSCSKWAVAGMLARGIDPTIEDNRKAYAHQVALSYMEVLSQQVRRASKDATVYFNSRPLDNLAEEIDYLAQVEIEALPTGGWGYMYFPKNVRYARRFGKPYLGMTARFHKSWADFGGLKPEAALEYETAQMMAHGARCSIGDQLHPRGTLDTGAYQLIGKVFSRVEAREPWCYPASAVTDIGVMMVDGLKTPVQEAAINSDEGATRMLMHLKHQFDLLRPEEDFGPYKLIILPDKAQVDSALAKRLSAYLKAGGKLLASGTSGLTPAADAVMLKELGIKPSGLSPFKTPTYIRFGKEVSRDVPPSDHVMYDRGVRVKPAGGKALAQVIEPYFDRTWQHFSSHAQTPGDRASGYAAATINSAGNVGYIAYPIFSAYGSSGNYPYRLLVRNLLDLLLPETTLRLTAPTSTEATVMQQPAGKNPDGSARPARLVVHLLQYCPERRTKSLDLVEDVVPLHDVPVSLASAKKPRRVYTVPDLAPLAFEYADGRVSFTIPKVEGHAMVAVE